MIFSRFFIFLPAFLSLSCSPTGPMDPGMHRGMWGMGVLMWLLWILIILALAVFIWLVVAASRRSRGLSQETPEQILKARYAKGEVDDETYKRMLADLRK